MPAAEAVTRPQRPQPVPHLHNSNIMGIRVLHWRPCGLELQAARERRADAYAGKGQRGSANPGEPEGGAGTGNGVLVRSPRRTARSPSTGAVTPAAEVRGEDAVSLAEVATDELLDDGARRAQVHAGAR